MRQPTLFIGHGSPMTMVEQNDWTHTWQILGKTLPRPNAILMISAHWYPPYTAIQSDEAPDMIYDMYGFPEELYQIVYPAKTPATLIARVRALLKPIEPVHKVSRGYDHGAYAPLLHLYPEADVPVVQLAVQRTLTAAEQITLGQALRPLRDEGVLIIGSGNIVHNLRKMNPRLNNPLPDCGAFDARIIDAVQAHDIDTLANWRKLIGASCAAPTADHLSPLFYVVGASYPDEPVRVFNAEFSMGSLSMTSFLIGETTAQLDS